MKRRDIVRSLVLATALVPISAPARPARTLKTCEEKAFDLADAMGCVFGGEWRVSIQKDFVLISRKL